MSFDKGINTPIKIEHICINPSQTIRTDIHLFVLISMSSDVTTTTTTANDDQGTAKYVTAFCAVPDQATADKITDAVVSAKLVACVNVLPAIKSAYWWEGKVVKDSEVLLMMKTRRSLVQQLDTVITKLHPYDVHELAVLPIVEGNAEYLKWIEQSTMAH